MKIFLSLFCYFISVNLYSAQGSFRDTDRKLSSASYTVIQHIIPCDILRRSREKYFTALLKSRAILDQLFPIGKQFSLFICEYAQDYQGEWFPCTTIKNAHKMDKVTRKIIQITPGRWDDGGFASASCNNLDEPDVKIWTSDGALKHTLPTEDAIIYSILTFPNRNLLISSSILNIKLWDSRSGKCLQTIPVDVDKLILVGLPDNQFITQHSDRDWPTEMISWYIKKQQAIIKSQKTIKMYPSNELILLTNGNIAFVNSSRTNISIWNPVSSKVLCSFIPYPYHNNTIDCIAPIIPKYLAMTSLLRKSNIAIWDTATGIQTHTLTDPNLKNIHTLLPLRDGRLVAVTGDGTINFCNIPQRAVNFKIFHRNQKISCLTALSSGQFAVGLNNGSIIIYNQRPIYDQYPQYCWESSLKLHTDSVITMKELPGGKVVSIDAAGTAIIWDSR